MKIHNRENFALKTEEFSMWFIMMVHQKIEHLQKEWAMRPYYENCGHGNVNYENLMTQFYTI